MWESKLTWKRYVITTLWSLLPTSKPLYCAPVICLMSTALPRQTRRPICKQFPNYSRCLGFHWEHLSSCVCVSSTGHASSLQHHLSTRGELVWFKQLCYCTQVRLRRVTFWSFETNRAMLSVLVGSLGV